MGLGLRASRTFEKNELITQYDGTILANDSIPCASHVISKGKLVIDGLKEPKVGFGGGSFANHSENPNAKFHLDSSQNIFLKATQPIAIGDFIHCRYSKKSVKLFTVQ